MEFISYQGNIIIDKVSCGLWNSLLEIDNDRIIVAGYNVITIVNISNDIIEHQIKNDKLYYAWSLIQLRDGNILCRCSYGLICLYNIKLNTITFREDKIHNGDLYYLLNLNQYQFISCSSYMDIKVWEY